MFLADLHKSWWTEILGSPDFATFSMYYVLLEKILRFTHNRFEIRHHLPKASAHNSFGLG